MTIDLKRWFLPQVISLIFFFSPVSAQVDSAEVPRHLAVARELVQNIAPENNRYVLVSQFISFPGDAASNRYSMRADCSGFLLAIFDRAGTTGHIFLINSRPRQIAVRKPVVAGTRQFEVSIIDSNQEHVGDDDSRLTDPSNKIAGLGTGTIRIYSDSNGELVGWARTFSRSSRFFSYSPGFPSDTKARKAVVGRPETGS